MTNCADFYGAELAFVVIVAVLVGAVGWAFFMYATIRWLIQRGPRVVTRQRRTVLHFADGFID